MQRQEEYYGYRPTKKRAAEIQVQHALILSCYNELRNQTVIPCVIILTDICKHLNKMIGLVIT